MRVTLTCNIRPHDFSEEFVEWDEPETIEEIKKGIVSLGHNVEVLDCHTDNLEEKIKITSPEFVFNIAEGLKGEGREGVVPDILDKLDIPYSGSSGKALNLCLNKAKAKEILQKEGIPTPKFYTSDSPLKTLPENFHYPVIVKPLHEGSSSGIKDSSVVRNDGSLFKVSLEVINDMKQPFILEEFITGREFTVAMIGNNGDVEIFPIVEINFSRLPENSNPVYGYEAKWIWDRVEEPLDIFTCPAIIDADLENEIKTIALNTFKALNCKDWARIDLRLDDIGKVNVLEVNPLPGIIPDPDANSCFPKAARAIGYSYVDILKKVINSSFKRYNISTK